MARIHELASASLRQYIVKYSERVHMARMHELASASPPHERVPNILRYTVNNLLLYTRYDQKLRGLF